MANFSFLDKHKDLSLLQAFCEDAENFAVSRPDLSAISARKAVEFLVKYIYKAKGGENCDHKKLIDLINSSEVQNFINDQLVLDSLNYIRILGNNALHGGITITKSESALCLENLYFFVAEVLTHLQIIDFYPTFDNDLPTAASEKAIIEEDIKADDPKTSKVFTDSIKEHGQMDYSVIPDYLSEAKTRKIYIDARLKEAGWSIASQDNVVTPGGAGTEIYVEGMPNESKIGYADYVLYGKDGLPLAVVEAKKTIVNPEVGREQGILYCDCLEKKHGFRPILYYTNGCDYWVLDGIYPDRKVSGFHNINELDYLIKSRNRSGITDRRVDLSIVDRTYQVEAVHKISEHFDEKHRGTLLVMATGTGKTRVAVAAVDVLLRNNWVKNVLFLADRTALVKQAERAFRKHLPNQTSCILSEDSEPNMSARLMFSTYQTVIHCIDKDEKDFGIGRFDLIIVDEAHRSIFNKYKAIFTYFDSLLLGLTATPREDVDKNTYDVFGCESGVPDFDYSYEEAVNEGYLSPFKEPFVKTTSILATGIRYDDLSPEEKEEYENAELYKEYDDYVPPREINKRVMNKDTIDIVLNSLMENGLKIDDGNKLGKTIIFATSHNHAQLIVERFRALYPNKGDDFCQLIDHQTKYHDKLIEDFETHSNFQIAVSVDMLDTGIDVPEVLNLVFFKAVRSRIKFWQMIGRGTRLCKDLLAPGKDKERFLIFDWCGNFDYFSVPTNGSVDEPNDLSLNQKIFNKRLEILRILQTADNQNIEFNKNYYEELKSELINTVKRIKDCEYRILVRDKIAVVDKYCKDKTWEDINEQKESEIKKVISPLVEEEKEEDVLILKFDFKMLLLEYELLGGATFDTDKPGKKVSQIQYTCKNLLKKGTIPSIKENEGELRLVASSDFWKAVSLSELEHARKTLRELMIFLDGSDKKTYYTDFTDTEMEGTIEGFDFSNLTVHTYREKVYDFLSKNGDNPVIRKIKNIEKLDKGDFFELGEIFWNILGTKDDYDKAFKGRDNLAVLVRSIVELDNDAVNKEVNDFIEKYNLNSDQIAFIRMIIEYVNKNGDIDLDTIIDKPPFDEFIITDLFGNNTAAIKEMVKRLHDVVEED